MSESAVGQRGPPAVVISHQGSGAGQAVKPSPGLSAGLLTQASELAHQPADTPLATKHCQCPVPSLLTVGTQLLSDKQAVGG